MRRSSLRRGQVAIEYVLLFSLVGGIGVIQIQFPDALGGLFFQAADKMPTTDGNAYAANPTIATGPGTTPSAPPDQDAQPPADDGVANAPTDPWVPTPWDDAPPEVNGHGTPPADPSPSLAPVYDPPAPQVVNPSAPPSAPTTSGTGTTTITTFVDPFVVLPGGGLDITGPASPVTSVLGSAIQYGVGGAEVPVKLQIVVNGVKTTVFSGVGSEVTEASALALQDLTAEANVEFIATSYDTNGRVLYSRSTASDSPFIIALRNGDYVPDYTPYGQQPTIKSFLTSVIDPVTNRVKIGEHEVLYLVELGTNNAQSAAADFQDLVFKVTFATSATGGGNGSTATP